MPRNRRPRQLLLGASIVALIGAWPAFVDAHAVFVGAPATVPAGADIALTMNVPHERDDTTYNVGIAIRLPEGWTGVGCQNKPTWTCSIGPESGHEVVRFDKDPQAAPAEDETFTMTLHAGPTPGTASFPTLQTYNTGETVAWIGDPSSAEPAPSLQVTGAAPVATTAAATPTTTPTSTPTTVAQPVATVVQSPTTTAPPTTSVVSDRTTTTTTVKTSSTTSTPAEASTSTTASTSTNEPISTALTVAPTASAPSSAGSDDGSPVVVIVIVVLAVLAAGGGAFAYLRHRRVT